MHEHWQSEAHASRTEKSENTSGGLNAADRSTAEACILALLCHPHNIPVLIELTEDIRLALAAKVNGALIVHMIRTRLDKLNFDPDLLLRGAAAPAMLAMSTKEPPAERLWDIAPDFPEIGDADGAAIEEVWASGWSGSC